ncbi:metal-dependent hydrolase [Sphingorhabdus contaminans]|uniref:metal-dependent hydrolase n=1 Tax=Sphingorhabdus contaminans TaxID=1343899 RepID=UPI003D298124
MDNLTHSLVGALLGQAGLKRKTGLAMPTLIIAANIPDIDAVAVLLGGSQHLALRRGITHGPIAMVVLPLLLWGLMLWFDRWQTRRGKRPESRLPVDTKWLLALAYIGCLSHPLFDWFNSYGIRLFEPFSSQWFYGDTIFIIDIWLWCALILGVWLSLRGERRGRKNWRTPALVSMSAIFAYIAANGLITGRAEQMTGNAVQSQFGVVPAMVVANPIPVLFWKREMLWRDATHYGQGSFSVPDAVSLDPKIGKHNMGDAEAVAQMARDKNADAFLFWSRMPVLREQVHGSSNVRVLSDQRFSNPLVQDRFTVAVPVENPEK